MEWLDETTDHVRTEQENGNHFLRLRSGGTNQLVQVYRVVSLPTGIAGLELCFRVRYEGIKVGRQPWHDGRLITNILDAHKVKVGRAPHPYFRGTRRQWQTQCVRFLVPTNATALEIMPTLFMAPSGTLDLDDLSLRPLGDAEAAALLAAHETVEKRPSEQNALIQKALNLPPITPELRVEGNRLVTSDGGEQVWLQGLSCDSMQWGPGENILWTIRVALTDWKANVVRLPIKETFWFGQSERSNVGAGTAEAYRQTIDGAVRLCAGHGAWLILDLHRFRAPTEEHVGFWKDAAARYRNHPAVLFELFNEPHGISWEVWRNGGMVTQSIQRVEGVVEGTPQEIASFRAVGMQEIVDAVRTTGARNVVLVGGLDWAYDLSGLLRGFALEDREGNGIAYVSHIYPWKRDWEGKVLAATERYPVVITEVGCQPTPMPWQSTTEDPATWAPDVIGMIQKYRLHWTAFSFHPKCAPMVIQDWNYTPTPYWGTYVKQALSGKEFVLVRMR